MASQFRIAEDALAEATSVLAEMAADARTPKEFARVCAIHDALRDAIHALATADESDWDRWCEIEHCQHTRCGARAAVVMHEMGWCDAHAPREDRECA